MFGFFRQIHLLFVSLVALVVFGLKLVKRYQDKPGKRPPSRSHRCQEALAKAEKG